MTIVNEQVWAKLREVRDPEFGHSIVERELVDGVDIEGAVVRVRYHLTVPFCPLPFALHIGREIRRLVSEVPGVERVEVVVNEHLQTEEINAELAS
ncbi:MAG TPA: iron-sulfur cluster assembly protein [Anaerolineae bacterium]|nr:iron-sulfur cluster assembly protein [Anaerolineae bacterium]HOQ97796.1 iron-sulfur cluster assembly protein [Anaerolineae bacterium]HPL27109.1 iron-sulfur cluster assembly protein [Anaerolineae bacterium]